VDADDIGNAGQMRPHGTRWRLGAVQEQHTTAHPRRYELASLEGAVSADEILYGGDYLIRATVPFLGRHGSTVTAAATESGRRMLCPDGRSSLTLRFAKHCEEERDRVLVAIARAADSNGSGSLLPGRGSSGGGSLMEELQRRSEGLRASLGDGTGELRRSVKRAAAAAAGKRAGGGANSAAMQRTGSGNF